MINEELHNIYYNQALEEIRSKRLEAGREKLLKAVKLFDRIESWNLLGLVYDQLGRFESAKFCMLKSLEIQPIGNRASNYLITVENEYQQLLPALHNVREGLFNGLKTPIIYKTIHMLSSDLINKVDVLNFLGLALMTSGDKKGALEYWSKSMNIAIDGKAALYLSKVDMNPTKKGFFQSLLSVIKGK